MYEAMEENQTTNQDGCTSSSPDVLSPGNHDDSLKQHTSHLGTVIPNRIFVGGIDYKVNERDLRCVFSQHGAVKEVKIVFNRLGISKGYGFVTFETEDDALKVLNDVTEICVKNQKLNIGLAVRKQQASGHTNTAYVGRPGSAKPLLPMSCGSRHQTSTGYPHVHHNGVGYFQCPTVNPPHQHWPRPATPLVLPQYHQPVYQPPSYPHYQCVPNQYQWNVVQQQPPSGPVMYSQPSEYLYQPADGGSVQPPLPVMDDTSAEVFPHSHVHLRPKYR